MPHLPAKLSTSKLSTRLPTQTVRHVSRRAGPTAERHETCYKLRMRTCLLRDQVGSLQFPLFLMLATTPTLTLDLAAAPHSLPLATKNKFRQMATLMTDGSTAPILFPYLNSTIQSPSRPSAPVPHAFIQKPIIPAAVTQDKRKCDASRVSSSSSDRTISLQQQTKEIPHHTVRASDPSFPPSAWKNWKSRVPPHQTSCICSPVVNRLFLSNRQELDVEDQVGVAWNWAGTLFAVSEMCGNGDSSLTASSHASDTDVPTLDDLADTL